MSPDGLGRCVCGCGGRAVHRHHVVYRQQLARVVSAQRLAPKDAVREEMRLVLDERNIVPVGHRCHGEHHGRGRPLALACLPDSCFEFALEVLGAGPAYTYLARRYSGGDDRHDALLTSESA